MISDSSANRWFVPQLPPVPSAHQADDRPVDLADPVERLLHAFLGRGARFALAGAVSEWMDLPDSVRAVLPQRVVAAQDQVVAALRVGAAEEPPVEAVAEGGAAYLWAVPCLDCGAEAERACMGVPSALHVHTARLFAVLLVAVSDAPAVCALVESAYRKVLAHPVPVSAAVVELAERGDVAGGDR
ncbi:hypothetical protein [Saccharothrix australiensis]|uniref:Uncharacterized protein n=1 Tax=Saccharothrix australiensis TaxID=2072 RepID=A0A495VIZ5_9PSEU|nr:hypothetical protein [Saccharothrix australiensis]RKT49286.1 hypothetical protein C8E97_6782 [Saccharothrix australiensis]